MICMIFLAPKLYIACRIVDVRAVTVDEDTVGIGFVTGVAADVRALVDDQDLLASAGEALGDHAAGETGADNDYTG